MKIREHRSAPSATGGGPGDVIAAVPHLLGFHPHASLVAVCVDLARRRTGLLMRLDLPGPGAYESCAQEVALRLACERPDAVILLAYGDDPPVAGTGHPPDGSPPAGWVSRDLPHHALIERLAGELAAGPVVLLGSAYVHGGRWWTYDCDHPGCCPAEGVPLPRAGEGPAAQVAARAALRGRLTLASRSELQDLVGGPSGVAEEALLEVFARVDRELADEALRDGAEAVRRRTTGLVRTLLAQAAEGPWAVPDTDVARLSLGTADVLVRDRFAALEVPDPAVWLSLLTELARRTPDSRAAAVCTVLAWIAYQHGDGALANVALDRVEAVDPEHSLAGVLRDCIDGQVHPAHLAAVTRRSVEKGRRGRRLPSRAGAA